MKSLILHNDLFKGYKLIDCGENEKLEQFGEYITIRPEPFATWPKTLNNSKWLQLAHLKFHQSDLNKGVWEKIKHTPLEWKISFQINDHTLIFNIRPTKFKHLGIFPEQALNWNFIYNSLKVSGIENLKVLNLFAYTGGASLAARASGADVTHLDSIKQVVTWAKSNMLDSGFENIRWIIEDAIKFIKRELKRGNRYHGIIMDPPAFGKGPNSENWKFDDQIEELLTTADRLLSPDYQLFVMNAYSKNASEDLLSEILSKCEYLSQCDLFKMQIKSEQDQILPAGICVRLVNSLT